MSEISYQEILSENWRKYRENKTLLSLFYSNIDIVKIPIYIPFIKVLTFF